jgi:TRAP-type C4-dicarboxylate transport system permease large subunit
MRPRQQGMTGHEVSYIARAAVPMFLIMVLMVFILIAVPDIATWLPEGMHARPGG